jgi:hypothetical protein
MNDKIKTIFGAAAGVLYTASGTLQFVWAIFGSLGGLEVLRISGDLFNGFVLLVIGAVLLTGALKIFTGAMEGVSFIYVGLFLSVLFGAVALCSTVAGAIEATFFAGEGESAWSAVDAVSPLLYLAATGAIGLLAWGREFFRGSPAS